MVSVGRQQRRRRGGGLLTRTGYPSATPRAPAHHAPAPAHVWGWNPSAVMLAHLHFSVNSTIDIYMRPILVRCDLGVRDALAHVVWPRGYSGPDGE